MDLHLECIIPKSALRKRSEINFRYYVEEIIPDEQRYPSLEKLSVTFAVANPDEYIAAGLEPGSPHQSAVTLFPLKHLPSLKHLEVQTDLHLVVHTLIPDFLQRGKSKFPALQSLKSGDRS